MPARLCRHSTPSPRTAMPVIYVLALGFVQHVAGPGCAGLVSTFPSMSLVVLAVTHLEAGAAEASRIAKVLPAGNTSTLAFLAAFRLASPAIGVAGATIAGYAAAVAALLVIEGNVQVPELVAEERRRGRANVAVTQRPVEARDPKGTEPGCVRVGGPRSRRPALDAHPQAAAPPRPVRSFRRDVGVVSDGLTPS